MVQYKRTYEYIPLTNGLKLSHQDILELLREGDFTLIYWEDGYSLYKGKWITGEHTREEMNNSEIDLTYGDVEESPIIVRLLFQALNKGTMYQCLYKKEYEVKKNI